MNTLYARATYVNKLLAALGLICVLVSCQQAAKKEVIPAWNSIQRKDTTFNQRYAAEYFAEDEYPYSNLLVRSVDSYAGEVIRARLAHGWVKGDIIATVVRDTGCYVQLIQQSDRFPEGNVFKEQQLPRQACNKIFAVMASVDFLSLPYNLERDRLILDANVYSLTYRGSEVKHVIRWQVFSFRSRSKDLESQSMRAKKQKAEAIYHEIFTLAQRTAPCVAYDLVAIENDTLEYKVSIDGSMDYVSKITYECSECRIILGNEHFGDRIRQKLSIDSSGTLVNNLRHNLKTFLGYPIVSDCWEVNDRYYYFMKQQQSEQE